jgi:hypothetical protein
VDAAAGENFAVIAATSRAADGSTTRPSCSHARLDRVLAHEDHAVELDQHVVQDFRHRHRAATPSTLPACGPFHRAARTHRAIAGAPTNLDAAGVRSLPQVIDS